MAESIKILGIFEMKTFKLINGVLRLIDEYKDPNKVVDAGREKLSRLLANDTGNNWVNKIGFGTDGTTPTVSDTSLTSSVIKSVDSYSYVDTINIKYEWNLGLLEGNGKSIREYGLFCDDLTLFSRKVRTVIEKEADILLEGSWTINFV